MAFSRFENNLAKAKLFVQFRDFSKYKFTEPSVMPCMDDYNPIIISNNMIVPFIVSIIEDYFKWTYVALLKYSESKSSILKSARYSEDDLLLVSDGLIDIEEATARWMSFQDLKKISGYFRQLNRGLDINGVLHRPYRQRKESLYSGIERIIEHRHLLIHESFIMPMYTDDKVKRDLDIVEVAIKRVYDMLLAHFDWDTNYP